MTHPYEFVVGDVVDKGGVKLRYCGKGIWQRVSDEPLAKRFALDEGDQLGSVRAAADGGEIFCGGGR